MADVRTPRLVASCDLTKLPIGAVEGFVLSRIDGATTISELVAIVGLPADEVTRIVERLADVGAIDLPDYTRKVEAPPARTPMPPARASSANIPKGESIPDDHPDMSEPSDLDAPTRKRILALHARLDEDYYALLGVGRDADRKTVKAAYYAYAATFHPDRHFGKNLGVFKQRMEAIFGRLTEAHDVLATPTRRAEYDQYLADQAQARAFEALLDDDVPLVDERPVTTNEPLLTKTDSRPLMDAVREPQRTTPTPPVPTTPSAPPLDEKARREALARKLMRSSRRMPAVRPSPVPAPRTSAPPVPPSAPGFASQRPSGFQRRDDSIAHARRAEAARHVTAAEAATFKGDFVAAANSYRLALQHHPDPEVQRAYDEVTKKAKALMVDVYLKNAKYEEAQQQWGMAALSYIKALDARPDDWDTAIRAANVLRREGRDLHRAAQLAQQAVAKAPNKVAYRVTLGHVYLDAGLFLRARSELEAAARLAPQDTTIRELLNRARKAAG